MKIIPSLPDKLPLAKLKWESLIPLLAKANQALGKASNKRLAALALQEAKDTFKAQGKPSAKEIKNYLKALKLGEKWIKTHPVSLSFLKNIHALLTTVEPGQIRKRQNWVGPKNCTLEEAYFYPPAPRYVSLYLKKLEKYIESDDLDPLLQLAIVFAQFLIIHPFMDGNGRIARLLIPLFLYKKGVLKHPNLFLSNYFYKHRKEYFQRLLAISTDSDWKNWIAFFLKGIIQKTSP